MNEPAEKQRLQKYLASRGVASRRAAEQLIAAGRVSVNERVVTEMGILVDPRCDTVMVDGVMVQGIQKKRYILLNKPVGYICSVHDERGRRTVLDLLSGVTERVYPVGRLDYDTSGLLLLTNDGELTNRLLHPSHEINKTYRAQVEGRMDLSAVARLRRGIRLEDGQTSPAQVRVVRTNSDSTLVDLTIHEGRNRQVRRMLEAVGFPVRHLKRIRLAFLDVQELPMGQWRELTSAEVARLKAL